MSHILEAEGLNTFYGRSHILFDVSLSVDSWRDCLSHGPQRSRQNHYVPLHHGIDPAERGQGDF